MRSYKGLLEALNPQQRAKRSMIARRTAKLRSATRQRKKMRRKTEAELNTKARRSARKQMMKRFTMGADWKKLSASAREQIEKMVDKRRGAIEKRALRMMPQVRKGEAERLKKVQRGR